MELLESTIREFREYDSFNGTIVIESSTGTSYITHPLMLSSRVASDNILFDTLLYYDLEYFGIIYTQRFFRNFIIIALPSNEVSSLYNSNFLVNSIDEDVALLLIGSLFES